MRRWLMTSLVFGTAVLAGSGPAIADGPATMDRGAVEQIVRDYLKAHPELVIDAIEAFKRKQEEEELARTRATVDERWNDIQNDPGSPVGGNTSGDVTVVEFFDYRCGVCKRVHPIITELMDGDRGIRRVFKEWPILGAQSVFAARAALASRKQGKYLAFHKAMMEEQGELTPARVFAVAASVGIDTTQLERDMNDPEIMSTLQRNFALAEALQINGTPSFVIGREVLRGARDLDTLRGLVNRARRPPG